MKNYIKLKENNYKCKYNSKKIELFNNKSNNTNFRKFDNVKDEN